jgi:anti-sigma regulatory factor (Ser/Thr protein kinase)
VSDRSGREIKPSGLARPAVARGPDVSHLAQVLPARIDALTRLAAFAEEVSRTAGFTHHDCLRLTLVLEELFTNTVEHGYGGDSEAPVSISCDTQPGRVIVTYEDAAPRFDPRGIVPSSDAALADDDRPTGKLGLLLVARMAADLDYARVGGRNRVSFAVQASG